MNNTKDNLIVDLTLNFALNVIKLSEEIRSANRFEMASQIFRSGTSIGANVREAQNSESNRDFIHKFKVAAKEADEIQYWLELCEQSEFYPNPNSKLISDLTSIQKVINKIISSSKMRNN